MLLIADSGSTKTDWRVVDEEGKQVTSVITEGLNPYFVSKEKITAIIRERILPVAGDVEKVFFYGAGCGLAVKASLVKEALDTTVSVRLPAEVSGDILGAARSLLQGEQGIACILGTGANSCIYDGRAITSIMPSLGYMFSDWGSGTVMSKDLIALLLQEKLPAAMLEDFTDTYKLGRPEILDHIYNKPLPNRFLASFTPFLLKYAEVPECKEIILTNFRKFFNYYVLRYPSFQRATNVSFTGSIAYRFQSYLLPIADEMGIAIQDIVQHPMDGLVKYHCITVPVNY
ncbi:MAG TPA: N-acetylglucosamine kinase [Ohtaekwangia sp.]|nr:N-acetylglucosamine kinase [Ohtaekwangia sp.]